MGSSHIHTFNKRTLTTMRSIRTILFGLFLVVQGTLSMKCYSGVNNIHGIPGDLEEKQCKEGVVNCAKLSGTIDKLPVQLCYWDTCTVQCRGERYRPCHLLLFC